MGREISESSLIGHFSIVKDPRKGKNSSHNLIAIIVIAVCAIICNADGWYEVELFGNEKIEWFKKFLDLPNGIPSHDTFGRIFSQINPEEFKKCFLSWVKSIQTKFSGEVIAIDGKTNRGSHDVGKGKPPIHLVSAWAHANQMTLGQVKVDEKSNEITAIPQLLEILALKGCIVTIDAMGCQKDIAKKIISKEADYVLALKGNQGNLHKNAEWFFDELLKNKFQNVLYDYWEQSEKGHGRIETRRCWVISDLEWFTEKSDWANLSTIAMVESDREINGKKTSEKRYYISSMEPDAKKIARAIRARWAIENSLHWVLDVTFHEDKSRIRKDHAPENIAILRHFAINLLKKDSEKRSIKSKRLKAGWNNEYLEKILLQA